MQSPICRVVFYIEAFNSLDHLAPVCLCYLNRGKEVALLIDADIEELEHPMLGEMTSFSNFEVVAVRFLDRLRFRLFENRAIRFLANRLRAIRNLKQVLYSLWPNRLLAGCEILICGYNDPHELGFQEALSHGIPVVCIPHGYNIFTNEDLNPHIHRILKETGKSPDLSGRNAFTKYVVNSPQTKALMVKWGLEEQNLVNWGSARFDPAYSTRLLSCLPEFRYHLTQLSNLRLAFFLPNLDGNVVLNDLAELLNLLSQESNINLCIRYHTRIRPASRGALSFQSFLTTLAKGDSSVHIESKAHSASIVKSSDVVMTLGTSIALEALLQRKPLILPNYLSTNSTIFDDSKVATVANSHADCLEFLSQVASNRLKHVSSTQELMRFLNIYVFNSNQPLDVSERYVDNLEDLRRLAIESTRAISTWRKKS